MIKAEKGNVQIAGINGDIFQEFGTIVGAMVEEYGLEFTIDLIATGIDVFAGKANKIDLSGLSDALNKLKEE